MPIPTHPPDCQTLLYPLNCRGCNDEIYHLSCNHNSSVLLDDNRPPWPVHHCGSGPQVTRPPWLDHVTVVTRNDRSKVAIGIPGLDSLIRPGHAPTGPITPPRQRRQASPGAAPDPIVAVPPGDGETRTITGVLREIERNINAMKAFGYNDDNPLAVAMAKAILGNRWVSQFGRITVHTQQSDRSQLESYTAFIPTAQIKSRRINTGITVSVKLTSVDVSDRYRDWYCDGFQVV